MTREEAIHELKMCKAIIEQSGHDYLDERDVPLIDLAIEALSEPSVSIQPKTIANNCDLISRADAIERIANDNVVGGMKRINEYRDSTEHNDYLDGISTAIATVDDLPSADRPSGEWLRHEDYGGFDYWECSNCKEEFYFEVEPPKGYNYCPSCGARIGETK